LKAQSNLSRRLLNVKSSLLTDHWWFRNSLWLRCSRSISILSLSRWFVELFLHILWNFLLDQALNALIFLSLVLVLSHFTGCYYYYY